MHSAVLALRAAQQALYQYARLRRRGSERLNSCPVSPCSPTISASHALSISCMTMLKDAAENSRSHE